MIYHDALSTFVEKECQDYIRSIGWYHRFIRCMNDTNADTRYEGKLVGNSPELCQALDAYGFSDLTNSIVFHTAVTSVYERDDPRRFKMSTRAEVEKTMKKCWEVEPTAERIKQDILSLPRVLEIIIEHRGCVVPDEFTRHGKRYQQVDGKGDCKNKPKARQRKDTQTCRPLHPDAVEAYEIIMNDDDVNQLNMLEGIPLHADDENLAQLVQVDEPGDGIAILHVELID